MTGTTSSADERLVAEIRGFNRFYVDIIGLHQRHILGGPFTLAEARVLLEIGQNGNDTHRLLRENLHIDNGYLSRIVSSFIKDGLLAARRSKTDGRSKILSLTAKGLSALAALNEKSNAQIADLISHLSEREKTAVMGQFKSIELCLSQKAYKKANQVAEPLPYAIRTGLRPGDAGRIIALHGELYAREYKYDGEFEAYVAKTFYDFLPVYDSTKDRVWIVERDGRCLGSLAALGKTPELAQLRWFVLSPELRGLGLGRSLLKEAVYFCEKQGHKRIYLETTADLDAAIHLYTKAGFRLVKEHTEQSWGKMLTHRYYELDV